MKKVMFSFLVAGAIMATPLISAHAHEEEEWTGQGEYDYDTQTYSLSELDEETEDGGFTLFHHDPWAGGGVWSHDFIGIKSHFSKYNHYSQDHRASVSNSRTTLKSTWKGKNDGAAYQEIAQSMTKNKAYWNKR